ncbi:MAG TPA: chromosomal replication initiator DnaA [Xanthobacteraceae bacterium]|jgi:chromosomal replication initiation ATPase DnaA
MTGAPRQLALALDHPESLTREDFLSGPSNAPALALIECWPAWPNHSVILTGPEGAGKSHLAAIWAEAAGARVVGARSLELGMIPRTLATGAVVIEDLVPGAFDERALFHLLNLAREDDAFLLLTARVAPADWKVGLRDLASRLQALPIIRLAPPDDPLLRAVLVKLFADRQIAVDEHLIGYLATRIERSFAAARAIVAKLDAEAMGRKRPLTRALAAEVLRVAAP